MGYFYTAMILSRTLCILYIYLSMYSNIYIYIICIPFMYRWISLYTIYPHIFHWHLQYFSGGIPSFAPKSVLFWVQSVFFLVKSTLTRAVFLVLQPHFCQVSTAYHMPSIQFFENWSGEVHIPILRHTNSSSTNFPAVTVPLQFAMEAVGIGKHHGYNHHTLGIWAPL